MNNGNLIHGILPGSAGVSITSILDKVDAWNDMSISARNDSWRMGKHERKKMAEKLDKLASEIVTQLHDWKLELARLDSQEKLSEPDRHVEEEYY